MWILRMVSFVVSKELQGRKLIRVDLQRETALSVVQDRESDVVRITDSV